MFCKSIQAVLYAASKNWGIKVERVELKDVKLPTALQRAMASEAEATRDARAKVNAERMFYSFVCSSAKCSLISFSALCCV